MEYLETLEDREGEEHWCAVHLEEFLAIQAVADDLLYGLSRPCTDRSAASESDK